MGVNSHHRATWQTLEVQVRHPWLCFVEDSAQAEVGSESKTSPAKISKQVRGVWVASDSCNLFGLGLTTSIRLTSLRHKKLTSQRFSWIGNLSLMYLNVFYVQTVRALPCWGLHSASSSKLRLWKVVESCLPEVEVWQCRAPLCNLTNRVSTKGPELTSLNLWVVRHVLWYPLQQFHPRNYWGFRVDGRVAKGLKRYHVPR